MSAAGRTYRGMSAQEREADRRRRLLDAALELMGTQGYANTTITEVCAAARVTARAFYDHFASREQLLIELYRALVTRHAARVAAAITERPPSLADRVRAGIEAAVKGWTADERVARICLLEIVGAGPEAESARHAVIDAYVQLLVDQVLLVSPKTDHAELRRTAVALVGAATELIVHWLMTPARRRSTSDELSGTLRRIYMAALPA